MLDLLNFTSEYRISKVLIGSLNSGYHITSYSELPFVEMLYMLQSSKDPFFQDLKKLKKAIISFALVGYEIGGSQLNIYHLISNVRSWKNVK